LGAILLLWLIAGGALINYGVNSLWA
jgi:hypothetical protein